MMQGCYTGGRRIKSLATPHRTAGGDARPISPSRGPIFDDREAMMTVLTCSRNSNTGIPVMKNNARGRG